MLKWVLLFTFMGSLANASSTRTVQADSIASPASLTKLLNFSFTGQTASTTLTLAPLSTTSQTLNIPNITATDTLATLGLAQTFSGAQTFSSAVTITPTTNQLKLGTTNVLTLTSPQTTSQTLTIPNITAADTLATLGLAQTFSGAKTFSAAPTFSTLTTAGVLLNSAAGLVSSSAGPLAVANGGTGSSTALTQWGVKYASTTTAEATTAAGTLGFPLVSNATAAPTFQVLGLVGGGTNNTALSATAGGVIYTDGTKLVNVGAGTSGQFLKSNGAAAPAWASVTLNYQKDVFYGNGTSTTFTLSFTPLADASTLVMQDGIVLINTTDYTFSGTTLTMVTAPVAGQVILVQYAR